MAEPRYVYDVVSGEYRDAATGEPVPDDDLRDAVEVAIAALVLILIGLTRDLQAGKIELAAWQAQMGANLRAAHLAVGVVGYGGLGELTPARLVVLQDAVRVQLGYLDSWAQKLARAEAPVDGTMLTRAGLYGQSPRGTWGEVVARQAEARGAAWERNQLHPAEHCAGCLAADSVGWVRIRTLPPPGQRSCLGNCRCKLVYRTDAQMAAARLAS